MVCRPDDLFLGIDCGTSGVRVAAINASEELVADAAIKMTDAGSDTRAPATWLLAMQRAIELLVKEIDARMVRAIAVDGTSGTLLAVDAAGKACTDALMYNDPIDDSSIIEPIAENAPAQSAVHGANSGLARFVSIQNRLPASVDAASIKILHQADWLGGFLSGRYDTSDQNNALKTGYDSVAEIWPKWIARCGADTNLLPRVLAPGSCVGRLRDDLAVKYAMSDRPWIVTGTTDGCASFLATGASEAGDAVTALGTTLTIKLLSDKPIFAPEFGIYSHRLGNRWLAGGASNSGGNVLLHYFNSDEIGSLSRNIDASTESSLDYYPLVKPGERFPINDPLLAPRVTPRPDDDTEFLKGLLTGIANIESLAYERLQQLGAPAAKSIRTVGGGASNPAWNRIRERTLGISGSAVQFSEAAAGTALLALQGFNAAQSQSQRC